MDTGGASLAALWDQSDEEPVVPKDITEAAKYGDLKDFSPRMKIIVDRVSAPLTTESKDKLCRLLSKVDFVKVKASNLWDEPSELDVEVQQVTSSANLKLPNEVRIALDGIWRDADFACEREIRAKVNMEVVPKSLPPLPRPVLVTPLQPQAASSSSNPYFKKQIVVPPPRKALFEENFELRQAQVSKEIDQKHLQVTDRLWAVVEAMAENSELFLEYDSAPAAFKPKLMEAWRYSLRDTPTDSIASRINTAKRWTDWATELNLEVWKPSLWHIKMFLFDQQHKGPTVARSQRGNLLWMQKNFKINLYADDPTVEAAAAMGDCGELDQAIPLQPAELVALEFLATNENQFVATLACTWLILANVVLRFAHLQRSCILSVDKLWVIALASLSKSKKAGKRRPFRWIMGRVEIRSNGDWFQRFLDITKVPIGEPKLDAKSWLLADFGPKRANLAKVTQFEGKPMSIQRFHKFSIEMFSIVGLDSVDRSSYSARRMLPTVADILHLPPDQRVKVGAWSDNLAEKSKRQTAMPDRYSHHSLQVEGEIKVKLMLRIKSAVPPKGMELQASNEWPKFLFDACDSAAAEAVFRLWLAGETNSQVLREIQVEEVKKTLTKDVDPQSSSSEATSSSSSSSDSEDSPQKTVEHGPRQFSIMWWKEQQHRFVGFPALEGCEVYITNKSGKPFVWNPITKTSTPAPTNLPQHVEIPNLVKAPETIVRVIQQGKTAPCKNWSLCWPTQEDLEKYASAVFNGQLWHAWKPLGKHVELLQSCVGFEMATDTVAYFVYGEAPAEFQFLRYHCTAAANLFRAIAEGSKKLAVGFSITTSVGPGVYFAENPEGAFAYIKGGTEGLAAFIILKSQYCGKRTKAGNTNNMVLRAADRHQIVAAMVFRSDKDPSTYPDWSICHPVLSLNVPQEYKNYCLKMFDCNQDGKCMSIPKDFQKRDQGFNVSETVDEVQQWHPDDFKWLKGKKGALIHLLGAVPTKETCTSACNITMVSPALEIGFTKALATGRALCPSCLQRAPKAFEAKLSAVAPALFRQPDI